MMRSLVGRLAFRLCASAIVKDVYCAVLRREPDREGLAAYTRRLTETGDLNVIIREIASSKESWERHLFDYPDGIVEPVVHGLLGRAPRPEEISRYTNELIESEDLAALVSAIANSREHWERSLEKRAEEIARGVYQGLFGCEPEPTVLANYAKALIGGKDVAALVSAVGKSGELRDRTFEQGAEKLVGAVYLGLLGREPEPKALTEYGHELAETKDLAALLSSVASSEEHWRRLIEQRANELVRAAFRGLLGREPEPVALAKYGRELAATRDLAPLLSALSTSREHRERLLAADADRVVPAAYGDRRDPLASIAPTDTQWVDLLALRYMRVRPPGDAQFEKAWAFIHIQKTAGTSVQNMLCDALGATRTFREHRDSLHLRCAAELSRYKLFAGHFNHDSLAYIPRRVLEVFTFVRDPRERLISHYRFLRAHEPTAPTYSRDMELANRLTVREFFSRDEIFSSSGFWNHQTWCVMGQRCWNGYRQLFASHDRSADRGLLDDIAGDIRLRLREFLFVGLQEDFERSCERLFIALDMPMPAVRADHSVRQLASASNNFKIVENAPVTPEDDSVIARYTQVDDILYAEATALYRERMISA